MMTEDNPPPAGLFISRNVCCKEDCCAQADQAQDGGRGIFCAEHAKEMSMAVTMSRTMETCYCGQPGKPVGGIPMCDEHAALAETIMRDRDQLIDIFVNSGQRREDADTSIRWMFPHCDHCVGSECRYVKPAPLKIACLVHGAVVFNHP